jgi:hypothetical protein
MATYNGHPSWRLWNVSLWVGNDEGLYRLALDCIRLSKTRRDAARYMLYRLVSTGHQKTPDGAPYSANALRHAMRGLS